MECRAYTLTLLILTIRCSFAVRLIPLEIDDLETAVVVLNGTECTVDITEDVVGTVRSTADSTCGTVISSTKGEYIFPGGNSSNVVVLWVPIFKDI